MAIIDCDAHVEESEATWSYLPPEWHMFRPFAVKFPQDTYFGSHDAAWVIDYKIRLYAANPTIMTRATQKGTEIPIQEMNDVPGRLAAMHAAGHPRSAQRIVPGAGHFFRDMDDELVDAVAEWLATLHDDP